MTLTPNTPPIRVLIADDSAVMRAALSRVVESAPAMQVCGTARHGLEALEKVRQLRPDVVTLDVEMPVINGLEVLKRIMREFPRPVIMVSALTQEGAEVTLEALGVGAFDYLPKSESGHPLDPQKLKHDLIEKIEAAAQSPLARQLQADRPLPAVPVNDVPLAEEFRSLPEIVVMGTSTGGPKALQEILPQLPADLPVGVVVVQHMPAGFTAPFAKRLDSLSKLKVQEASHGETVEPGSVYIAPAGKHATISRKGSKTIVHLSSEPSGTLHKPSVDVTMLSVAEEFGRHTLGVIMTGMGSDGLHGMTAIRNAGGITIGQDEATSAVYGMPRCCAEHGILQKVVPLQQLPWQIMQAVRYRTR
jgi:two-component system, chemotaxis family, protein-glutamate methylesterase/glutaminase